jgi:hypothetical protein
MFRKTIFVSIPILILLLAACTTPGGETEPDVGSTPTSGAETPIASSETPVSGTETPVTEPEAEATTPVSPEAEINTYDELVAALQAAGLRVEPAGEVDEPIFNTTARAIQVNGAQLQVFEFPDEAARQQASDTIEGAGFIIGATAVDWIDQPNFWATGNIIVLYVGQDQTILPALTNLLGETINEQNMPPGAEQPAAVAAALQSFSQEIGALAEEIEVVTVQEQEWPNGCLGLGNADELCTQAIVPGWQIIVRLGDQQYEVRTDLAGQTVRWQQEAYP